MNVFDKDVIDEVWEGDLEIYVEIGKIFLDELIWWIFGLKILIEYELEYYVYFLKGVVLNIGVIEFSCFVVEFE